MPPTRKSGLRILAGLPEKNGLTPASGAILDDPGAAVYVVMRLSAEDEVRHLASGTSTAVVRIEEVEVMAGEREEAARKLLDGRRGERRSEETEQEAAERAANGEEALPFRDDGAEEAPTFETPTGGDPVDDAVPDAVPDPAPAPKPRRSSSRSSGRGRKPTT